MEQKNTNWYLGKGISRRGAEDYAAGRKRLVKATPFPAYTLILEYEDGERRIYDCRDLPQAGPGFEFLKEYKNFERVYVCAGAVTWDIDPNVDSRVVWENQVDLCPDCCYAFSRHIFQPCEEPKNYETVTVHLDPKEYWQAKEVVASYGLTLEEAVTLWLEDSIKAGGFPEGAINYSDGEETRWDDLSF